MTTRSLSSSVALATLLIALPAGAQNGEKTAGNSASEPPRGAESEESESESQEPSSAAKREAADRFQRGLSFYDEGDYGLALIEFERAYQLVPDYRVLYNIGQVSIQLSRASQALRSLEQYLQQGGKQLAPDRVESVEADLKMLRARTALLTMSGTEGAEVFVDDERVGVLPLPEPLLVDAGRHRVEVKKDGFRSFSERVTLAGAEERSLSAELEKNPRVAPVVAVREKQADTEPQATQDAPLPAPVESGPPLALIGWSTTGVLAVGALASGGVGLSNSSKLKDLKSEPNPNPEELDQRAKSAKNWLLAADILGVAAIATGSVSLYFTLKGRDEHSSRGGPRVGLREDEEMDWRLRIAPNGVHISTSF